MRLLHAAAVTPSMIRKIIFFALSTRACTARALVPYELVTCRGRDESVDWVRALTGIMAPYEGGTPRYHSGNWRLPFDGRLFTELEETCFRHQHVGDPQAVIVDRTLSVSFIAALPEAARAEVERRLQALIAGHPDLRGRDTIAAPYHTQAYRCFKIG